MIHDEVRNVIKAAGAVTGPSGVGMITEQGGPTLCSQSWKIVSPE